MWTSAAAWLMACGATAAGPTTEPPEPPVADAGSDEETAPAEETEETEEVEEAGDEGADEPTTTPPPVRRAPKPCVGRAAPGEIRTLDVDSDGSTDVWEVTRGGLRYCREADLNFDGQPDLVTFYDSDGREEVRREMDLDFDGHADVIEVRSGGIFHRMTFETATWGP